MPLTDTLRFALGDAQGLSSLSWRVWVKKDGDAYIACRDNYQELKVSLHGSRWRVGLTAESEKTAQHLHAAGTNRAWEVWDRPDSIGGVTMGYRILLFPSESTLTPDVRESFNWREVEFLGVPVADWTTIVTVTINEPGVDMVVEGAGDQAVAFLDMPEGQRLQVSFHTEQMGTHFQAAIGMGYQLALKEIRESGATPPNDGRLIITGNNPLGHFACEVNMRRPYPDPLQLEAPLNS